MLESLDIMISLGVIFLVLSMVQKYVVSLLKRLLKTKAKVVSKEMKTFIGEHTSQYLELYVKHKAKHLNLFESSALSKEDPGFRLLNAKELKAVTKELREYLDSKSIADLKDELYLGTKPILEEKLGVVKAHLEALQTKAETVYDNTLRKINEIYTKEIRQWTFLSALILVFIMNASFFDIYKHLSTNALVRDKLVYNTESFLDRFKAVEAQIAELDNKQVDNIQAEIQKAQDKIDGILESLPDGSRFFGWKGDEFGKTFSNFEIFISKMVGFLISALLISFGAPFWHDYLETFVKIRRSLARKSIRRARREPPPSVPGTAEE